MMMTLWKKSSAADKMEKIGQVIRRKIAAGSKSEREALMLCTAEGDFVLRRMGGNPGNDAELERMVGQTVKSEGELAGGYMFLARQITRVEKS
jgi:hypothetical protein